MRLGVFFLLTKGRKIIIEKWLVAKIMNLKLPGEDMEENKQKSVKVLIYKINSYNE